MTIHNDRDRSRSRSGAFALVALATALIVSPSSVGHAGTSTYSIDIHRFSAGGGSLRNDCYRLSGTVGQAAPGYSSGATYSVNAGFWPAVAVESPDQLFFSGFQGCSQ
jgi:hypothetical protein